MGELVKEEMIFFIYTVDISLCYTVRIYYICKKSLFCFFSGLVFSSF